MSRANPRFRRPNAPLPPPTKNTYEIGLVGVYQQQETLTTYYYVDEQAVGSSPVPATLATAFIATCVPAQAQTASTAWSAVAVIVRTLTSPTNITLDINLPSPVPGVQVATELGSIPAPVIDRVTAFRGQCGRGHIRPPGITEVLVDTSGSSLGNVGMTTYTTFANVVFNTDLVLAGHTFTPALASRGTRVAPKILGVATLVSFTVRSVLGTARRRKLGRGM